MNTKDEMDEDAKLLTELARIIKAGDTSAVLMHVDANSEIEKAIALGAKCAHCGHIYTSQNDFEERFPTTGHGVKKDGFAPPFGDVKPPHFDDYFVDAACVPAYADINCTDVCRGKREAH